MGHKTIVSNTYLDSRSSSLGRRQVMNRRDRDCVILGCAVQNVQSNFVIAERLHTKIPSLQGTSSASPWTVSLSAPPAFLAIFRRLKLLSSPIVQRLELRFEGRGRYFPLPHPESRPIEPVGMESKNVAITGHGCQIVKQICCRLLKLCSDFVASGREVVCNSIVDLMYVTLLILERVLCLRCKLQHIFRGHERCGRGQVVGEPRGMFFCHLDPVLSGDHVSVLPRGADS